MAHSVGSALAPIPRVSLMPCPAACIHFHPPHHQPPQHSCPTLRLLLSRPPPHCPPQRNCLYVADTEAHALREVDLSARSVRTLAGTGRKGSDYSGGASGGAQALNSPWDVALDRWALPGPGLCVRVCEQCGWGVGPGSVCGSRGGPGSAAAALPSPAYSLPATPPHPLPPLYPCLRRLPAAAPRARSTWPWQASTRSGGTTSAPAWRVSAGSRPGGRCCTPARWELERAALSLARGCSLTPLPPPAPHPPVPASSPANFSGSGYERNQNGPTGLTTAWAQPSGLSLAPAGDALFVAGARRRAAQPLPAPVA